MLVKFLCGFSIESPASAEEPRGSGRRTRAAPFSAKRQSCKEALICCTQRCPAEMVFLLHVADIALAG
eukprot:6172265-Pleurochrysis_carterae.AAC.1